MYREAFQETFHLKLSPDFPRYDEYPITYVFMPSFLDVCTMISIVSSWLVRRNESKRQREILFINTWSGPVILECGTK